MNSAESASANAYLRIFLHVIFKRKTQVIAFFTLSLLMVGIVTIGRDPLYQAEAQLMIKMGREHVFIPTSTEMGGSPFLSFSSLEQINSEIELINSQPIIEKAVHTLGPYSIYKDLLEDSKPSLPKRLLQQISGWLFKDAQRLEGNLYGERKELSDHEKAVLRIQKRLEVFPIKNSRIIQINFEHSDPVVSSSVVNNIVAAYLEERPHVHKSPESYEFFEEQSKVLRNKIRKVEEKLKSFRKENSVIDLDEERSILLQKKADLKSNLNESLSEKVETEKRIDEISKQLKATPAKIQQGEDTGLNPYLISTLESQLVTLELKERELLTKYTDNNHLVQDVKKQLKIVRNRLAEYENKPYGSARFGLNPTHQRLNEELYRNEAELEAINAKIKSQEVQLADYDVRLDNLNQVEHMVNELQDELKVDKENYQLYLTKHEESRIASEMDSKKIANVGVVKSAQIPLRPMDSHKKFFIALGIVVGIFGSIGFALFLEHISDKVERPEDIEEHIKTPVLASVPKFK
jgi:uncharacterized protein involved in exopolysaccharide biosynthesis